MVRRGLRTLLVLAVVMTLVETVVLRRLLRAVVLSLRGLLGAVVLALGVICPRRRSSMRHLRGAVSVGIIALVGSSTIGLLRSTVRLRTLIAVTRVAHLDRGRGNQVREVADRYSDDMRSIQDASKDHSS
jgi:FtsH-binding integral membrane protein